MATWQLNDSTITQTMKEIEGLVQSVQYIFLTITEKKKKQAEREEGDGKGEKWRES